MISLKRFLLAAAMALLVGVPARAQSWEAGASVGLVNDVEKKFQIDEFKRHDVSVWAGYEIEDKVILRAMFGSLRVQGSHGGETIAVNGAPAAPLPDLPDLINYGTLGVAYEFLEENFKSGIFAGIGGYRIEPEATEPALRSFQDVRETVLGWHVGVDGSFQVASHLSILGRFTIHKIKSAEGQTLLTAHVGLGYRF